MSKRQKCEEKEEKENKIEEKSWVDSQLCQLDGVQWQMLAPLLCTLLNEVQKQELAGFLQTRGKLFENANVPDNVVFEILESLDTQSLLRLRQINRSWKVFLMKSSVWTRFDVSFLNGISTASLRGQNFKQWLSPTIVKTQLNNLQELKISNKQLPIGQLANFIEQSTNLLKCYRGLGSPVSTNSSIAHQLAKCHELEKLHTLVYINDEGEKELATLVNIHTLPLLQSIYIPFRGKARKLPQPILDYWRQEKCQITDLTVVHGRCSWSYYPFAQVCWEERRHMLLSLRVMFDTNLENDDFLTITKPEHNEFQTDMNEQKSLRLGFPQLRVFRCDMDIFSMDTYTELILNSPLLHTLHLHMKHPQFRNFKAAINSLVNLESLTLVCDFSATIQSEKDDKQHNTWCTDLGICLSRLHILRLFNVDVPNFFFLKDMQEKLRELHIVINEGRDFQKHTHSSWVQLSLLKCLQKLRLSGLQCNNINMLAQALDLPTLSYLHLDMCISELHTDEGYLTGQTALRKRLQDLSLHTLHLGPALFMVVYPHFLQADSLLLRRLSCFVVDKVQKAGIQHRLNKLLKTEEEEEEENGCDQKIKQFKTQIAQLQFVIIKRPVENTLQKQVVDTYLKGNGSSCSEKKQKNKKKKSKLSHRDVHV
jgi:hypothetical protein